MNDRELSIVRHAHSLINGLHPSEDGFYEALDEATEALQSLLPDDNNWALDNDTDNVVQLFKH
jgi:hypothetical protein